MLEQHVHLNKDRDTRVIWCASASAVIGCAGPLTPNATHVEHVRRWLSCWMEQSSEMAQGHQTHVSYCLSHPEVRNGDTEEVEEMA